MSEMIDRLARALQQARPDQMHGFRHEHALVLAHAAIEAMREPTPKMVDVGVEEFWLIDFDDACTPVREWVRDIYLAMVTARPETDGECDDTRGR
jgi:hypothetical protein